MEDELDDVADGDRKWQPVVEQFYTPLEERWRRHQGGAQSRLRRPTKCARSPATQWSFAGAATAASWPARASRSASTPSPLEGDSKEQPQAIEDPCPDCGKTLLVRRSKRGPFVGCTGYPECRYTRPLEGERAARRQPRSRQTDEKCPECESPMVIRSGRFGQFLACSKYPECKGAQAAPDRGQVPQGWRRTHRAPHRRGTFYGCANYPECDFTVETALAATLPDLRRSAHNCSATIPPSAPRATGRARRPPPSNARTGSSLGFPRPETDPAVTSSLTGPAFFPIAMTTPEELLEAYLRTLLAERNLSPLHAPQLPQRTPWISFGGCAKASEMEPAGGRPRIVSALPRPPAAIPVSPAPASRARSARFVASIRFLTREGKIEANPLANVSRPQARAAPPVDALAGRPPSLDRRSRRDDAAGPAQPRDPRTDVRLRRPPERGRRR